MSTMRINHMELTFPEGALTVQKKQQIGDFYRQLFGWNSIEIEIVEQKDNPDIQIKEYEDLVEGPTTVHAFYVKYLLPIWFDVQCIEYEPGAEPSKQWSYQ